MMVYAILFLFCILFVELIALLNMPTDIQSIIALSRKGIGTLTKSDISDAEKEIIVRRHSLLLFRATFLFIVKILSIVLIFYSLFWAISYFNSSFAENLSTTVYSFKVIGILTLLTMGYMWCRISFTKNYNFIERILHYVAFSTPFVQSRLVDIENDVFKKIINTSTTQKEVFIAGLPRAGTTLLLELLYDTDEFSTFTYRNMPFILSPLLWNKLSSYFQISGKMMERAHGDGMKIGFNSPEAFEEIVWLFYMRKIIDAGDHIRTLSAGDQTPAFEEGFKQTVKKLIASGRPEKRHLRYLSKNNANISRIGIIRELFPTASIIIPFRHPLAQVGSLIKQHRKFTALHKKDKFSKRYMKWLGHFDFGENFKPINFDNWLDNEKNRDYSDKNFWLKYWTASYTYMINQRSNSTYLVDFDKLLKNGQSSLSSIADCLGLNNKDALTKTAERLRPPTSLSVETDQIQPEVLDSALNIHKQLISDAI